MNIGFDISTLALDRTGIGQYQYNLLQELIKIDKENFYHLYGFNLRNNKALEDLKFDGDNYEINAKKIPQRLITAWWLALRWPKLEKVVKPCDIYQVSEICQQPTNAKSVAFIHDLTTQLLPQFHLKKNKFLYKAKFRAIKKYADAVLTNSHHTKRDIIAHLQIPEEKIFVTPLGVHERFKKITDKEKISKILDKYKVKSPYLLFVGTIEPRKNLNSLLLSFNELKKQENIPHKLVIVGKVGWFYKDIIELIMELGLKNEVILTGFVPDEDVPYLLNGAEMFIYPSFYEGFGLPILEAMACNVPVITSNTSSLPEVGGDAAVYIDPYNYRDLSHKIYDLLHNKELRKEMAKKGLERSKEFSWKNCALQTLDAYRSIT